MKNFIRLAFASIIVCAGLTACQKETESLLVNKKQEPVLPEKISVVSVKEMPQGAYIVSTRADREITLNDISQDNEFVVIGTLDPIRMNNKSKPKTDATVKITKLNYGRDNDFKFHMDVEKVGNMPGTLTIDVDNLHLNPNGTFHAEDVPNLHIDFLWGFDYNVSLLNGKFSEVKLANNRIGYNLFMEIESHGSIIGINIFLAHVEFNNKKPIS